MTDSAARGLVDQIDIAYGKSGGRGAIFANVLWEMGRCKEILEAVLPRVQGKLDGIACGAGMPFALAEICSRHKVWFYPIVSSARALKILWLRGFKGYADWLGGVIYEDPWLAGGHVGLSNTDSPDRPTGAPDKLTELRALMRENGIADEIPLIMAGGVWNLSEWQDVIDNPAIGAVAFQFGTRPILARESPVAEKWRPILMSLKKGDVVLNKFSPTGFWSMAVRNSFFRELEERRDSLSWDGPRGDRTVAMPTADDGRAWVSPETAERIKQKRADCVGCISHCRFSGFVEDGEPMTPDPLHYCIHGELYEAAHGDFPDRTLMFSGANAWRFAGDPLFAAGRVPTIAELVDAIMNGD